MGDEPIKWTGDALLLKELLILVLLRGEIGRGIGGDCGGAVHMPLNRTLVKNGIGVEHGLDPAGKGGVETDLGICCGCGMLWIARCHEG